MSGIKFDHLLSALYQHLEDLCKAVSENSEKPEVREMEGVLVFQLTYLGPINPINDMVGTSAIVPPDLSASNQLRPFLAFTRQVS